jgi:F0F1-type ATP synthase gamma subunit
VRKFREHYDPAKNDIIVIGRHGAQQLDLAHIHYNQYYDLPQKEFINVDPLVVQIRKYRASRVFYQHYMSLTTQDIRDLDLSDVVNRMGKAVDVGAAHLDESKDEEIINEDTYIFEPSPYAVTAHLESSMIRLTLTQFIYDSRLAQLASRFRAMSAAKERSTDEANALHTQYSRAKRTLIDTRLKEAQAGLKKIRQETAA